MGLVIGLLLAAMREASNSVLKSLKDVRAYTELPILGSIPLVETDVATRRRKRRTGLAWTMACLAGVAAISACVAYYYTTKI
jgi:hypothetical protein